MDKEEKNEKRKQNKQLIFFLFLFTFLCQPASRDTQRNKQKEATKTERKKIEEEK